MSKSYKKRRTKKPEGPCAICGKNVEFYWWCKCGFIICGECMEREQGEFTCNSVTWYCPDCGAIRNF